MPRNPPLELLPMDVFVACNDLSEAYHPGDWRTMPEAKLWHNLVTRILSTQSQWEGAENAANQMDTSGLLEALRLNLWVAEAEVRAFLVSQRPMIRWPGRKARHIWQASQRLYHTRPPTPLKAILRGAQDPFSARRELVELVPGIGMKQASHFLQSIGYGSSLVVIDRHLDTFLSQHRGGRNKPKPATYEKKEATIQALAEHHSFPTPVLDFAIWNVMRS